MDRLSVVLVLLHVGSGSGWRCYIVGTWAAPYSAAL